MTQDNFGQAMYEVNVILDSTNPKLVQLIPQKIINLIRQKAKKEKEFKYDKNKKLKDQDMSNIARGMIALIYRDYFCTEEEKKNYIKYYYETKEKKLTEKYNENELFHNKNKHEVRNDTALTVLKKETIFDKIKSFLIKLFK